MATLQERCQEVLYFVGGRDFFLSLLHDYPERFPGRVVAFSVRRVECFNHLLIGQALVTEHLLQSWVAYTAREGTDLIGFPADAALERHFSGSPRRRFTYK